MGAYFALHQYGASNARSMKESVPMLLVALGWLYVVGMYSATQETFVAAFAALQSYDRERPFAVWVKRIALNKCRDWARRRRVRAFFTRAAPLEDAFDVSDDTVPADVQAADRAELARVTAAMARLPARLREALVLRTVDGLTQAEAAEVLSVSEKTIETRLYRARSKLKAQLGDRM